MKNSEIRDLTDKELDEKIEETQKNMTSLRFNHKISDLDNPHQIKNTKKVIARLKTEKRKRELAK